MRKLFVLAAFVLLLPFIAAVSSESEQLTLSVSEAQQLVHVTGDFNFSDILPGFDYEREVTVEWNVPADSLQAEAPNGITIYGMISSGAPDSWISFKRSAESHVLKGISFKLYCKVENHACASTSTLSQKFVMVFRKPVNAPSGHAEEIVVNASLTTIPPSDEERYGNDLGEEIAVTSVALTQLPANQSAKFASEINSALDTARSAVRLDDYDFAKTELELAQTKLMQAQQDLQAEKARNEAAALKAEEDKKNWFTGMFTANKGAVSIIATIIIMAAFIGYYFHSRKKNRHNFDDVVMETEKEQGLGKNVPYYKK